MARHQALSSMLRSFNSRPAARLPGGGISELAVNSALAIIEVVAPKDEVEGALALQMACTYTAAMSVLARLEGGFGTERRTALFGSAAARLLRTYTADQGQVGNHRSILTPRGGARYVRSGLLEHLTCGSLRLRQ
jgi:hypothetical protein